MAFDPGVGEEIGDSSFGTGTLFREIGQTLQTVGQESLNSGLAAVRTVIARQALASPEGSAEIARVRNEQIASFLPWIIVAIIGVLFLGRLLR